MSNARRLPSAHVSQSGRTSAQWDSKSSGERPRYIQPSVHEVSVPKRDGQSRASTPESFSGKFSEREHDSANFKAAKELRALREAAGLTQEEAAALCGADPKTVRQRENGAVDLGPLKQRLRLVEAAREKYLAEEQRLKQERCR